jgi:Glycosyl transferase family 90
MPGVLFHHETPTKDWFYDFMEPYAHYIPVDLELKNLRSQYEWAEENPEKVKMIAENSTKFAENLLSADYLAKLYKELFVDYFGELIEAYQPQDRSWTECLELYNKMGLKLRQIAHCKDESCFVEWNDGIINQISKRL